MRKILIDSVHIRFAVFGIILNFLLDIRGDEARFEVSPLHFHKGGEDGFTLMNTSQTGIRFINQLSDREAAQNQIRLNGSGVALGDVDGDGLIDIYFCRLQGSNVLYRNLGKWRFCQVEKDSSIACLGQYSTGATMVDLEGDGDLDLIVNGIETGTRLFENDGAGRFSEVKNSGLDSEGGAMTTAVADVDGDGDLDLYITRYRSSTIRTTGFAILRIGEKRSIRPQDRDRLEITREGKILEHGQADGLYLNDGKGRFASVNWDGGRFLDEQGRVLKRKPFDWGLAAMFRDIDQDGDPDLYVCNDFHSEDRIWINDGGGGFQQIAPLSIRHTSTFSMAVDFADINRDGYDDFFVADMLPFKHSRRMMKLATTDPYESKVGIYVDRPQFDQNTLQLNRGDVTYAEIADLAELQASEWTWSASFLDVDLDGFEDLLCCTGHLFDTQDLDAERKIQERGPFPRHMIPMKLLMFPKMKQPKLAFRNKGDLTFEEVGEKWGFHQIGVAHGMAFGDLDGDGDLDVVTNNLRANAGLYRNNSSKPRILISLKGKPPNTSGTGARISLKSDSMMQSQEVISGGRYLSCDDSSRMFASLDSHNSRSIEVIWRNGQKQIIKNVKSNMHYTIHESGNEDHVIQKKIRKKIQKKIQKNMKMIMKKRSGQWFEDVSEKLSHQHLDRAFEDFDRERLLPRKMSQMGPGVAWFDWDENGWEDLIVGGGKAGRIAVFLNEKGDFERDQTFEKLPPNRRDQTGIVAMMDAEKGSCLWIGNSNFEDGLKAGSGVEGRWISDSKIRKMGIGKGKNVGGIAVADVDGDGDLDMFVGGNCQAGNFPISERSQLWLSSKNGFEQDQNCQEAFHNLGLVRGASFGDFTGDTDPDLVIVCDWGGIEFFTNQEGKLRSSTSQWGLDGFSGWWNGVATGDFDEDGRLDFVATNWGLNHPQKKGCSLFYDDFDEDGKLDLIEAYRNDSDEDDSDDLPFRHFSDLAKDLSFLPSRFSSLREYNEASLSEILGGKIASSKRLNVSSFHHRVFLNRGDHFEDHALPIEAQFAPGFGVVVGDVNLDRHEDIFIAQNFFPVQPFAHRLDSGRGIWLKGRGDGTFEAVSGKETGIKIYGEGRGTALADYDRDGRLDLAVTQNGAETKLYKNQLDRSGIRIKLIGNHPNPKAIGASIRIHYEDQWGPLKEINCGSGYWSQDSHVKIFSKEDAKGIWVRWRNGDHDDIRIGNDHVDISIFQNGDFQNEIIQNGDL